MQPRPGEGCPFGHREVNRSITRPKESRWRPLPWVRSSSQNALSATQPAGQVRGLFKSARCGPPLFIAACSIQPSNPNTGVGARTFHPPPRDGDRSAWNGQKGQERSKGVDFVLEGATLSVQRGPPEALYVRLPLGALPPRSPRPSNPHVNQKLSR